MIFTKFKMGIAEQQQARRLCADTPCEYKLQHNFPSVPDDECGIVASVTGSSMPKRHVEGLAKQPPTSRAAICARMIRASS